MYSIENQLSGYGNSKSHSEAIETALFTKYLSSFTLGDDSQLRSESKCDVIYSREILGVHDPIDSEISTKRPRAEGPRASIISESAMHG
ncbi:hypothetical protein TWF225_010743 [Orbilia oligospora]|nr:hypothetical protein TWF225_010743 [Orbilia oligospora]KAF3286558.1 hypothetical protein TWF132_008837 [Orbilia oligospora]